MHDFVLREIKKTNIENELKKIGFDKSYTHKAKEKFEYKNIKIYSYLLLHHFVLQCISQLFIQLFLQMVVAV